MFVIFIVIIKFAECNFYSYARFLRCDNAGGRFLLSKTAEHNYI